MFLTPCRGTFGPNGATSTPCVDIPLTSGVEATPLSNGGVAPFFCDICFLHYAVILKTKCCGQNICGECARGVVRRHMGGSGGDDDVSAVTAMRWSQVILAQTPARHVQHEATSPSKTLVSSESSASGPPNPTAFVRRLMAASSSTSSDTVPCPYCSRRLKVKVQRHSDVQSVQLGTPLHQRSICRTSVPQASCDNSVEPQASEVTATACTPRCSAVGLSESEDRYPCTPLQPRISHLPSLVSRGNDPSCVSCLPTYSSSPYILRRRPNDVVDMDAAPRNTRDAELVSIPHPQSRFAQMKFPDLRRGRAVPLYSLSLPGPASMTAAPPPAEHASTSPTRVGESFDEMIRKLKTLPVSNEFARCQANLRTDASAASPVLTSGVASERVRVPQRSGPRRRIAGRSIDDAIHQRQNTSAVSAGDAAGARRQARRSASPHETQKEDSPASSWCPIM